MNESPVHERYTVRLLKAPQLERPEIQPRKSDAPNTASLAGARASQPAAANSPASALPAGSSPAPALPQPQVAQLPRRSQILVQPDAPDVQLVQEVPVPVAMIWAQVNLPTKTLVAPAPQPISAANLHPAIIKPNREPKLADVDMSSTHFPASAPIMAASTSPVVMRGPSAPQEMPILSSAGSEQSTPARLISLSSLKATGDVAVPFANQSAQGGNSQVLAPPRADAANGMGGTGKQGAGKGIDQGTNAGTSMKSGVGNGSGSGGSSGGNAGGTASAQGGQGAGTGTGAGRGVAEQGLGGGYESSVTHLTMPKDGQFGVVVVGTSIAEEYPEAAEVWHGRLVYTVYLHVGASRNWIMQYSIPASAETAAGGMETKPEAPWPYDILRPHLSESDYTSDALIVHGFVNLAGRFERLGLVFPQGFAQAKFVLDSLMQWRFRPAKQGTKMAMVEVLLIIPAEQ
ncbi:MAG: hypothetical protein JST61_01065 [Acidobacteria bacterium]|nr:hypothetical protein [Acidobacteriota bacterium]